MARTSIWSKIVKCAQLKFWYNILTKDICNLLYSFKTNFYDKQRVKFPTCNFIELGIKAHKCAYVIRSWLHPLWKSRKWKSTHTHTHNCTYKAADSLFPFMTNHVTITRKLLTCLPDWNFTFVCAWFCLLLQSSFCFKRTGTSITVL